MNVHPDRARRTGDLNQLDPTVEWHEIYQRLTLWELPAEARFGFQLAFYRAFAVPRMASVLQRTGHFRRDTVRRAYDTGLVVHEIISGGVDSERGRRMIKLMNGLHDRPDIHAEDMTYLLNALIVVPTRFMDRYGWRQVQSAERDATWRFYDTMGERMGIKVRPISYADADQQLRRHEAELLAPSEAGAEITEAVLKTLRNRLPRPARPFAGTITSTLIGDSAVSAALSLPAPSPAAATVLRAGASVRRRIQARRPGATQPSFVPGQPAGSVYPAGYGLDDLGPRTG